MRPFAFIILLFLVPKCYAATCSPSSIAVDTTAATGYDTPIFGEAFAQVFTATAPLVSAITVWRDNTGAAFGDAVHLVVCRADSTGRPEADSLVADGGIVTMPAGYDVSPSPFKFVFSPPLQLPRPGFYSFAVQGSPCGRLINIMFADGNPYGGGSVWVHHQTNSASCFLSHLLKGLPNSDLVFAVEFCTPGVPAEATSWGRIKSLYR